jgi:serine protease Do
MPTTNMKLKSYKSPRERLFCKVVVPLVLVGHAGSLAAQDDLAVLEEAAFKAAAARVADSIVQIRTIGGLEQAGGVALGSGPTTGLVIEPDGWIVSSAFNFAEKPSSILVYLPDGTTRAARLDATDHSRMIVLLKVDVDAPLAVPPLTETEARVGQWAIALGKAYSPTEPNISTGIVSATGRMHGRAIQTDAKVSVSNYGGPLVDVRGQVLGILVPMSPESDEVVAGAEFYDSGIGFAIPMSQVLARLDELKSGNDQWPGKMGVGLKPGPAYSTPPEVVSVEPMSPASEAGIEVGDLITQVDGTPTKSQTELYYQVKPRYAGQTLAVQLRRGDETLTRDVTLVDKLLPYEAGFLGLLLERVRDDDADADAARGVDVRYVYPSSPAAAAEIRAGDRIVRIGETNLSSRDDAVAAMQSVAAGQDVVVEIARDDESKSLTLSGVALPDDVPENITPPRRPATDAPQAAVEVGLVTIKLPDLTRECPAYVPRTYRADVPHGLLVWLTAGEEKPAEAWTELCDRHDVILLAPGAQGPAWQKEDVEYIERLVHEAATRYAVDGHRVVLGGTGTGATAAFAVTSQMREEVRGVVAVSGGPPQGTRLVSDPLRRLAVLFAFADGGRPGRQLAKAAESLREAALPLTVVSLPGGEEGVSDDLRSRIAKWIDTLDRI